MKYTLEIAAADIMGTLIAAAHGADRIELCANLREGGTTPSYGMIATCKAQLNLPIFPIIRCRGGDFLYTDEEIEVMLADVQRCKDLGCEGVVFGALLQNGHIDTKALERLVTLAYPMQVTFHRAFDRCLDPMLALQQIINAGCSRILTSGQQIVATEGINLIKELQQAANQRISIMPGSGVRADNIVAIVQQTNCTEFHTSLRTVSVSSMQYLPKAFIGSNSNDFYSITSTDVSVLKAILNRLEEQYLGSD